MKISINLILRFTRQESKKADQRPVPKTYYVIDYRKIVDVVKWKLYQVKLKVNEKVLKVLNLASFLFLKN
jgi:transcription initiation factor TFIIE subunit alpha